MPSKAVDATDCKARTVIIEAIDALRRLNENDAVTHAEHARRLPAYIRVSAPIGPPLDHAFGQFVGQAVMRRFPLLCAFDDIAFRFPSATWPGFALGGAAWYLFATGFLFVGFACVHRIEGCRISRLNNVTSFAITAFARAHREPPESDIIEREIVTVRAPVYRFNRLARHISDHRNRSRCGWRARTRYNADALAVLPLLSGLDAVTI